MCSHVALCSREDRSNAIKYLAAHSSGRDITPNWNHSKITFSLRTGLVVQQQVKAKENMMYLVQLMRRLLKIPTVTFSLVKIYKENAGKSF